MRYLIILIHILVYASAYEWDLKDMRLDGATSQFAVVESDTSTRHPGLAVSDLYVLQSTNSTFFVDKTEGEECTILQHSVGSYHHESCSIDTLDISSAYAVDFVATLDNSTVSGVCTDNGGFSCASSYFDTVDETLLVDDVITYTYSALSSVNYYEILILLVNASSLDIVDSYARRGIDTADIVNQFNISVEGEYFMRVFAAGFLYDFTDLEIDASITIDSIDIGRITSAPTQSPIPFVCEAGRYIAFGSTCIECPEDTFSNSTNSEECYACPPGTNTGGTVENIECTPTLAPTSAPTLSPSASPTDSPSASPSVSPTLLPTSSPSVSPTPLPTSSPSVSPTRLPTSSPSVSPTPLPSTNSPSGAPTIPNVDAQEETLSLTIIIVIAVVSVVIVSMMIYLAYKFSVISRESFVSVLDNERQIPVIVSEFINQRRRA